MSYDSVYGVFHLKTIRINVLTAEIGANFLNKKVGGHVELHIATFFIKKHILCLMSTFNFNKEEEINLTIPLITRPSILKANKQKLIPTRFQNKKFLDWMQDMRLHCLQSRLSYVG